MHKKMIAGTLAFLMSLALTMPSMAKGPKWGNGNGGPNHGGGQSNIGHLYLYEKTPVPGDETKTEPWIVVEGGMWGKMKYTLSGPTFDFVFNGHGLPVGQEYTLIYYPDPWPAVGLICLGSGVVTGEDLAEGWGGNIHIKGSVDTGSLPIDTDANYPEGAKIFLVPSADVDCENQMMIGWTGDDANLYEGELIQFEDTDGIQEDTDGIQDDEDDPDDEDAPADDEDPDTDEAPEGDDGSD